MYMYAYFDKNASAHIFVRPFVTDIVNGRTWFHYAVVGVFRQLARAIIEHSYLQTCDKRNTHFK